MIDANTLFTLPLFQVAGAVVFVASMGWWMKNTFYERQEARDLERHIKEENQKLEKRVEEKINGVASEVKEIKKTVLDMARDTSYIRGRLEAKDE